MKQFFWALFLFFQGFLLGAQKSPFSPSVQSSEGSGSLYALVAFDTASSLKSLRKDIPTMKKLLRIIAKETHLRLKATKIEGKACQIKNIKRWAETLPRNSNDVVFFYFSGHGFRPLGMQSPWPALWFSKKKEALPLIAAERILEGTLHPRLLILLADCCNNSHPSPVPLPSRPQPFKEKSMEEAKRVKSLEGLFLRTRGVVIATAASPGQVSIGYIKKGSLFTNSFSKVLMAKKGQHRSVSWEKVLAKASSFVEKNHPGQVPIYLISQAPPPLPELPFRPLRLDG